MGRGAMQGVLEEIWLLERELGNVQDLLRDFEAKRQVQWGGRQGRPTYIDACLGCRNDRISYLRDVGEDGQRMATKFAPAYSEVHRRQDTLQLTEQVVETSKRILREEHPDTLDWIHTLVTLNKMLKC